VWNVCAHSWAFTITDKIGKIRFGRELPLSETARKELDSVCPSAGLIFRSHYYRTVAAGATAAGIDAYRAERTSRTVFVTRITHLGQVSSNLSGIMSMAGHRQPVTTARYMRPQKAAAGAGRPGFWRHSGYKNGNAKRRIAAPKTEQQRGP
jgi:hypothetical protein